MEFRKKVLLSINVIQVIMLMGLYWHVTIVLCSVERNRLVSPLAFRNQGFISSSK